MQFKRAVLALGLAGLVAGAAHAAQKQEPGFIASADFGHTDTNGSNANSVSTRGFGLGGQMPWAQSGVHIEVDGAYDDVTQKLNPAIQIWNVGAEPYYSFHAGRAGLAVHYIGQQGGVGSDTLYSYGAFGEWFATDRVTLGLKSATITGGGARAALVGGRLTGYFFPDLALSGTVEYEQESRDNSETDLTAEAEYLFSESLPISAFAGYTRANANGMVSSDVNLFFIGLKIYADGRTSKTLVDRQRNGTLGWLSSHGTTNF